MNSMLLSAENFVRDLLKNESSGHDFGHCYRVYNMANSLSSHYKCDCEFVALAALLHDVDDEKIWGNKGHPNLRLFCDKNGVTSIIERKLIELFDFMEKDIKDETASLETKIVQDADNLDALGAVGISRLFAYGGAKGIIIYDYKNRQLDSEDQYYDRLRLLPNLMNTKEAKFEANRRLEFMETFMKEFYKEIRMGDF